MDGKNTNFNSPADITERVTKKAFEVGYRHVCGSSCFSYFKPY